jgi:uncharacterized protein with HEPN domain
MRDKLSHEHFGVDTAILWNTAINRLNLLKLQNESLRQTFSEKSRTIYME